MGYPPSEHDTTRLELLAPLIKQSVELALELAAETKAPSPLRWTWELIDDLLSGEHPIDETHAWCFSHLYGMVTGRTNAIARLVEDSYTSASFALLRSVMEAFATCYYISERLERCPTICHNYIAYELLTAVYKMKSNDAKLRTRNEMEPHFPDEQFVPLRKMLKERFRAFSRPLAWLDPKSKNSLSTADIIEAADKRYAALYYWGNLEVHSNYAGTKWNIVLTRSTPLRSVPMVACGEGHFFQDHKELESDFLAAEMVIRTTELAPRFLSSADSFVHKATRLVADGKRVLEQLLGR